MIKADFIKEIHDETGIPKVDILVTLETFIKKVKQSVCNGEQVSLRGFGTFTTESKKERNQKKKTSLQVSRRNIPKFKPAKEFVMRANAMEVN